MAVADVSPISDYQTRLRIDAGNLLTHCRQFLLRETLLEPMTTGVFGLLHISVIVYKNRI